jgi:hypothetical protein
MKLKINVTRRDIKLGERGHYAACPVARACRRHKPTARAWVLGNSISVAASPTAHLGTAPLPDEVRAFIANFDRGEPVRPFRFTLVLA